MEDGKKHDCSVN